MTGVAVQGTLSSYRTLADGTLRVTVDLDELQSALFHEGFGHGAAVALARLNEQVDGSGEGSAMSDSTVRNL